jgi:hypothetical protein
LYRSNEKRSSVVESEGGEEHVTYVKTGIVISCVENAFEITLLKEMK